VRPAARVPHDVGEQDCPPSNLCGRAACRQKADCLSNRFEPQSTLTIGIGGLLAVQVRGNRVKVKAGCRHDFALVAKRKIGRRETHSCLGPFPQLCQMRGPLLCVGLNQHLKDFFNRLLPRNNKLIGLGN
jgi:hypothetical protein